MARLAIAFSGKYWYRKSGSPQAYEGRKNLWFVKIGLFDMASYYR